MNNDNFETNKSVKSSVNEDIEKVWFEGYIDESEEEMQVTIEDELSQIPYPKYSLADL